MAQDGHSGGIPGYGRPVGAWPGDDDVPMPGTADVGEAQRIVGEIRVHSLEQLTANLDDEENEALLAAI